MQIFGGSLRESTRVQNSQKSMTSFSKQAKENTNYRLFLPLTWEDGVPDVVTAGVFGRKLDNKALGRSFVAYDDGELEVNSMTGAVHDVTDLPKLAAIARAFHNAECEKEKKEAEEKAKEEALLMGKEVNPIALAETTRQIDVKYHGDSTSAGRVYAEKNPVISTMKAPIVTEVYAVPLSIEGVPDFAHSFVGSVDLSQKKVSQLMSVLEKGEYVRNGEKFLEVGYDYKGTSKQEAGRNAAFSGIAESLTLANKFPDIWEANKDRLNVLSFDRDTMAAKNPNFSFACTVSEVFSAFNKYISTQALTLMYLDFESKEVTKNAKLFLTLDSVTQAPTLKEKFQAIIEEESMEETSDGATADEPEDSLPPDSTRAAGATTLSELSEIEDLDSVTGTNEVEEL